MTSDLPRKFHPEKVAYYEKAGWQAYYERKWLRAFWLMVLLNRDEFHMSLPAAVAAATDIVRASIAFAPVDNDVPKAAGYLRRYYERARGTAGISTDAPTLARLEMDYWVVHRSLATERKQQPDLENMGPMVEALVRLHAALFEATPQAVRRSAELRARAAQTVDRITGRYSKDVSGDWRKVEGYLQQAYQAIADGHLGSTPAGS